MLQSLRSDLTKEIPPRQEEHHHRYVRDVIPRLRALLARVTEKHGGKHHEIEDIEKLFGEVAREMIMHIQKEEQILFPYIDAGERSVNGEGSQETPFFQTARNPIHMMMKEHDAAGEVVKQIRKASSEYTAPEGACTTFN
jgi:regulator of cell morphogenesis and NO signaling